MDEFHGQSGRYEVKDGKRVLVEDSVTKPHKDGDAARDSDGNRVDLPDPNAKPEPAMPAPVVKAPWAADAEATPKRARRGAGE